MIKNLSGVKERVDYEELPGILLYDNTQYEDYPNHWHSSIEIIMVLEGMYSVECNMNSYVMNEGDILIIAPGTIHHLYPSEGRRIIFQSDFSGGIIQGNLNAMLSLINPAVLITEESFPLIYGEIYQKMKAIYSEYNENLPLKGLAILSYLSEILLLTGRNCKVGQNLDVSATNYHQEQISLIMDTCKYIEGHCTENLSLEDAAAIAGFSKYHFSRRFKEIVGVSFYKYLNRCRISRAELLLANPNNSVTDVFLQSGFNSITSFIRMFKIINGCTPNEFRKMKNG